MQITERSQIDWVKFRELERRRHRAFFVPKYHELGLEIVEDIADDTKTNPYDVALAMDAGIKYVEEKTRTGRWDHFLVEIMQCLRDGKTGWFYNTKVDYVFDAQFNAENDELPHTAYMIEFPKLREFVLENFEGLSGGMSGKGYGLTYFKRAKWLDLEALEVAKRIV